MIAGLVRREVRALLRARRTRLAAGIVLYAVVGAPVLLAKPPPHVAEAAATWTAVSVESSAATGAAPEPTPAPAAWPARADADPAQVWPAVQDRLHDFFSAQGLPSVSIECAAEPPAVDPKSGKFRQVWSVAGE